MRRCSVAHCVCRSDWNRQISGVCIRCHEFTSCLYRPDFHSFAQTGCLRRWLDRRAGSPGVITSFVRSVVFSNACAAPAFALAGTSDKERHRSEEEGSSFTFVIARATSVLILFDQGAPRSKGTRKWSCTFPKTTQGDCRESYIFSDFCLHAMLFAG